MTRGNTHMPSRSLSLPNPRRFLLWRMEQLRAIAKKFLSLRHDARCPWCRSTRTSQDPAALSPTAPTWISSIGALRFVDKLIKGGHASDLPVEQPVIFDVVVNQRTAKAFGIIIPQSVLIRADEVIE